MWSRKGHPSPSRGSSSRVGARLIRPLSDRLILCIAFLVGLFICIVSAVANAFLLASGHPAAPMLMKFNAVGGVVAILLVWRLLRWSRQRNELARERDEVVVQLNHEIRNAIQAIALYDYCNRGSNKSAINLSIARIERALDDNVPNEASVLKAWQAGRSRSA